MRFVSPFVVFFIDAFGMQKFFFAGYLLTSTGFLFCRSPEINFIFIAGIILLGIGFGIINISGEIILIQMSNSKNQENRIIAINYVVLNLAASIGPIISGLIFMFNRHPAIFFLLYSIVNLLTGVCYLIFFPFGTRKKNSTNTATQFEAIKLLWKNKRFIRYIISLPPIWFVFSLVHTTIPVYILETTNLEKTIITTMFSLAALIVLFFGYPINRCLVSYCKKRNRSFMDGFAIGSFLMGLGIFSLWTYTSLGSITVYLFITLFTLGELCFVPMVSMLVNELKPDEEKSIGASFGIASLAFGVGQGFSNLAGGFFIEFCQKNGFFLFPVLLGILTLTIALMYLIYSNKLKPT